MMGADWVIYGLIVLLALLIIVGLLAKCRERPDTAALRRGLRGRSRRS